MNKANQKEKNNMKTKKENSETPQPIGVTVKGLDILGGEFKFGKTNQTEQICKSLFDAIQAHPPRSDARRLAIRRYQKANAQRTELKRAARLANQS